MWLAVIVLCSSAYTSCVNAQPVITTGTNIHQLVPQPNNNVINNNGIIINYVPSPWWREGKKDVEKAQPTIPNTINPDSLPLVPHRKNTTVDYNSNEVEIFTTTNTPDEITNKGGTDLEIEKVSEYAWERSGKIQGDMILNNRQKRLIIDKVEGMERNGLRDITKRWPNNEVIYYINKEHYSLKQIQLIENSMQSISNASCIKFRPYKEGDSGVVWIHAKADGCFADVGYQGGSQEVNLGERCLYHATVVHELLHTLGFYHMQSNHDRDNYITVLWDNIIESEKYNFDKYNAFTVTDYGVGYDYASVMHYHSKAFSVNGKDTMMPKKRGVQLGQAEGLSKKDKLKLNKMYCGARKKIGRRNPTPWYL